MKFAPIAVIAFSILSLASIGAHAQSTPGMKTPGASGPSSSPAPRPLTPTPAPGGSGAKTSLKALDKNHDGVLTRSEAGAVPGLARDFAKLDKNHDGKLDAIEFAAFSGGTPATGPRSSSN